MSFYAHLLHHQQLLQHHQQVTQHLAGLRVWRLALVALLACASLWATVPGAKAAEAACPDTFHVLHNDRIGTLQIPAGYYALTVLDSTTLTCAAASDLFRQFLEDYDGKLGRGWTLTGATFSRGTQGFRIAPASTPSGGGGGGRYPVSGTSCPGYFRVLHDDKIGAVAFPAGEYRVTLLAAGTLTCPQAATRFSLFLRDFDGVLPSPWRLDGLTGTFSASAHVGFRVKEAVGPAETATLLATHAPGTTRCPGTFQVEHDDKIGALSLPAGKYVITTLRGGSLTCKQASTALRGFLQDVSGMLPSPWVLSAASGTFRRGKSNNGFHLNPA